MITESFEFTLKNSVQPLQSFELQCAEPSGQKHDTAILPAPSAEECGITVMKPFREV